MLGSLFNKVACLQASEKSRKIKERNERNERNGNERK